MTCGVYQFWCGPYFYVGRSVNIEQRWKKHRRELENGTHTNPWVRHAFNKHGWTGQDILVECEPHLNRDNEQHFIDLFYGTEFCMNISKSADGGGPAEHTEETKEKMSATAKVVHNLPEVRAKNSVGVKAACARPEVKAKRSASQKAAHARPEVKAAHSVLQKSSWARPEVRAKRSAGIKAACARPEVKTKKSNSMKEVYARPGQREKYSEAIKAACASPGAWEKRIEAQNRPEVNTKRGESLRRHHRERKIRNFEAELADIPEGGDIISMFEVKHEEP